jgi:uncharacterized protein with PIN domain
VLAILFNESDAQSYARAITEADSCRISAANFVDVPSSGAAALGGAQFAFGQPHRARDFLDRWRSHGSSACIHQENCQDAG